MVETVRNLKLIYLTEFGNSYYSNSIGMRKNKEIVTTAIARLIENFSK